ncbi:importin-5-like protein [Tanacetum coccineum]
MPEVLHSAKLAVENGQSQGHNESYVKKFSNYIIPAQIKVLHKEPETEICASILDAINECVQICGPLLDETQVRSIVKELKQVITARKERDERVKEEDFDASGRLVIGKDRTSEEKRIAICIFDDVAEHCGGAAFE